jgi:ABC-type dipeptide/oligopeptide/nickel transport systems, permease components
MAIQSPSIDIAGAAPVGPGADAGDARLLAVGAPAARPRSGDLICGAVLLLIVVSALTAPWLGLADPYKTSMIRRLYPLGSPNFLLGTDELGATCSPA